MKTMLETLTLLGELAVTGTIVGAAIVGAARRYVFRPWDQNIKEVKNHADRIEKVEDKVVDHDRRITHLEKKD